MKLLFVMSFVMSLCNALHNLTHSTYYHYNFEDYTFEERYDAEYLKGKHCANLHLTIDHNTETTSDDLFKRCVEMFYPNAFKEYDLTSLRHVFNVMYTYFDDDYKNSFLYEDIKDSLYETYVDIQHDFSSFKLDIVYSAKRFVHPVYDLTMASTPLQGRRALNQSIDILNDLKMTIQAMADLYTTSIQTKSNELDTYEKNYLAARSNLMLLKIHMKKIYRQS